MSKKLSIFDNFDSDSDSSDSDSYEYADNKKEKKQKQSDFDEKIIEIMADCAKGLMTHSEAELTLSSFKTSGKLDKEKILKFVKEKDCETVAEIIYACMLTMTGDKIFMCEIVDFLHNFI